MPPLKEWDLTDALKEKYEPKLPPAFWKAYDHSIRAPNDPVVWNGGKKAERRALREAKLKEDAFNSRLAKMMEQSHVLIRYCGGCGFMQHAVELARRVPLLQPLPAVLPHAGR